MTDITNKIGQFERGMLVMNSPFAYFKGGKLDGTTLLRRFRSDVFKNEDEVYVRNGEIMWNDDPSFGEDRYYIVYKLYTGEVSANG